MADVCLDAVWQVCHRQLTGRYGQPWHQDADGQWQPTAGCVFGHGQARRPGAELQLGCGRAFSFIARRGECSRSRRRASKRRIGADEPPVLQSAGGGVHRGGEPHDAEGALYRIDLRLGRKGMPGPLSRSLAGYENYYAQWGQTWERMMLIKARGVAGDETLAAEFLETDPALPVSAVHQRKRACARWWR